MGQLISDLFDWLVDALYAAADFWVAALFFLADSAWMQVKDFAAFLWSFMLSKLPPEVTTWLESEPWAPQLQFMDQFNWIVPIYPMMSMMATVYGLAATIRLVRWLLGINIWGFSGGS